MCWIPKPQMKITHAELSYWGSTADALSVPPLFEQTGRPAWNVASRVQKGTICTQPLQRKQSRCQKLTSGTEKRVSRRSKKGPLYRRESRRPSSLLAVPGGPINKMCSPLRAASSISRTCT